MSDQPPSLELVLPAQQRERFDVATLRDDMRVMTAMLMRMDNTLTALLVEVRAMHARHDRLAQRVEKLEKVTEGKNHVDP